MIDESPDISAEGTAKHDRQVILALRPHYRSGTDHLGQDFFAPCLRLCERYRRAAGYFSSSSLIAWSSALPLLIRHDCTTEIQLLISPSLSEQDLQTLRSVATEADRQRIMQELADRIVEDATNFAATCRSDADRQQRLLAWVLATGRLELRFAFPRHAGSGGIFHEKIGVFDFPWGDRVAFTGSANESGAGHESNYESIDVFRGWVDADTERVSVKATQFDEAWRQEAAGLEVVRLSPAVLDRVRRRVEEDEAADGRPITPSAISENKWRHQDEAIDHFLAAERGILEMATGTGKTRTALRIAGQLLGEGKIDTVVVAADGNDLLDQWYSELTQMCSRLSRPFAVVRQYGPHKERDEFLIDPGETLLLVSRPSLAPALRALSPGQARKTMLIHDEVHRLGSPGNRSDLVGLSEPIRFRLGLSATPEREYDAEGTEFIENHIGPVIYRFELADAIARGILSSFDYHPIEWAASEQDRERIQQVYKKASAREAAGQPMTKAELWIDIANVYKTSRVKIPLFRDFVARRPELLERCIIFVETKEYGQDILEIVHRHRHDFHTYFAEDQSQTLRRFARGELECLITCHRLSEGIDIRSLRTVFLLSASRARLETIQRMGRCLRSDPDNPMKRSHVVDFIRIQEQRVPNDEPTADELRRDWLVDLSHIIPEAIA